MKRSVKRILSLTLSLVLSLSLLPARTAAVTTQNSAPAAQTYADPCIVFVDGQIFRDVPCGASLVNYLPGVPEKSGYTFLGWFDGETQVTASTTVSGDMNITSHWSFDRFADVNAGDWFYRGVRYAVFHELFSGVSPTRFCPALKMNRAMVVQVLYSLAGKPDTAPGSAFRDVPAHQWYAKAVAWAVKRGVASGYGNGCFGPEDTINREQLAAMLYSYAGRPAVSHPMDFADTAEISDWAYPAMQWAVKNAIMGGVGGSRISPKTTASRSEGAIMLSNFHMSFTPVNYIYTVRYCSADGKELGHDFVSKPYGTTHVLSAPDFPNYQTPAAQEVLWDSCEGKTILFVYQPGTQMITHSGQVSTLPTIGYAAAVELRNRTAYSVQVRVSCSASISRSGYTSYGQNFKFSICGVDSGALQIVPCYGWYDQGQGERSATAVSQWITIPLNTTESFETPLSFYYYQTNSAGVDMTEHYDEEGVKADWPICIPAF